MGCSSESTQCREFNKIYYTQNFYENANNNDMYKMDSPSYNYNKVNVNKKLINFISCPSCGEPFGKNFISSGLSTEYFNCFRCKQYQNNEIYYKCKICNAVFCRKCPQSRYDNFAKCPFCYELAGNNFKASGFSTEYFNCFKCGSSQNNESYYKCKNCNAFFCIKCPLNTYENVNYNKVNVNKQLINFISCPSCGEPFGKNFISSGLSTEYFNCFRCKQYQNNEIYYKCKICNAVFCRKCPQSRYDNFAKCPFCYELAGNNFKASGFSTEYFNCFKCGSSQNNENYYKCKNCNAFFCNKCPFSY